MSARNIGENNSVVYVVAYKYLVGERDENCPLKDFDNLSFKERVEKINSMSKEDIEKITDHHINCSKKR